MFKQHRRLATIVLTALLALLIGAALAMYFFRHSALIFSANRYLQPYGLTLLSISDVRIGVSEFHAGEAVLAVNGSDNKHTLHDMTIIYSASQLSAGKIDSLRVRQISLSLPFFSVPDARPEEEDAENEPPFSLLTFLQNFPVRSINIARLDIPEVLQPVSLQLTQSSRDLQLAMEREDMQLLVAVNWHDQNYISSHFIADANLHPETLRPEVLSGRLTLKKAESTATSLDFSLIDEPAELSAEILTISNTALTAEIVNNFYNIPENWPQLSGHFESNLEFMLTKSTLEIPMFTAVFNEGSEFYLDELAELIPAAVMTQIRLQLNSAMIVEGQYNEVDAVSFSVSAADATAQLTNLPDIGDTELSIRNVQAQCQQDFSCSSSQELHILIASLAADNFSVEGVTLNGVLTASNSDSGFTVIAEPGLHMGILSGSSNGIEIATATFNSLSELTLEQSSDGFTLAGSNIAASLPFIRMDEKISRATLNMPTLDLRMQDALALDMKLIAIEMASELVPVNLSTAVFESELSLLDNTLQGKGDLHMNGQRAIGFDITHQLDTSAGNGEFLIPGIQFDNLWNRLSDFIDPLPINIDLLSGSLAGSAQISWMLDTESVWQMSGPLNLQLDALSGLYKEIGFVGVRTELAIELLHDGNMRSLTSQPFAVSSIDIGFPVNNLHLDYGMDTLQGIYTVRNIEASIFEGRILSQGLDYDINAATNFLLVELQRIDIASLLSMAAYEAVNATGLVSGQLPITLTGRQITIDAGNLSALSPGGEISYRPAESLAGSGQISSGNANLDLVYEALANYQYQVLQSSVDYLDTGELVLSVKLEGSSPDMQSGNQRINLNLNISDNIPALLQSLQASRSIADALELRLQEQ